MKQDFQIGNDYDKWKISNTFLDDLCKHGMDENGKLLRPLREILNDFGFNAYKAATLASESPTTPQQQHGEICPHYKVNDLAHVGDRAGLVECMCDGRPC